jgi:hypothetical protein
MSDRFNIVTPNTPITPIDLSDDESLRHTGHTVAVILPSGVIFDLWFYDNIDTRLYESGTVSVDVRIRDRISNVNGDRIVAPKRVWQIPSRDNPEVTVVVAR